MADETAIFQAKCAECGETIIIVNKGLFKSNPTWVHERNLRTKCFYVMPTARPGYSGSSKIS